MVQLKHFIITQFNLRLWTKDKLNVSTYTEEWLSKRFVLFDTYCFPSVQKQTSADFIWLCLFDKNTPEAYLEKIKQYQQKCPQLKACFLDEEDTKDWLGYTRNVIKECVSKDDEFIATTNLDNDDSLHTNMIKAVYDNVNKDRKAVLYSFLYGYQYFTEKKIILKMLYPHNHFLSLVEKNISEAEVQTVKLMGHAKMRKHFDTIDLKTAPYWIEFVHNNNVNNDLRITSRIKYYPVFKTISLTDFGLNITLESWSNVTNTLSKMPFLFFSTAARKLRKKIGKKKD